MLVYKDEVERLINDMKVAVLSDARKELETTEIAAIVRQQAVPITDDETPDSLLSLMAQAAVIRAWRQHAENQRAA